MFANFSSSVSAPIRAVALVKGSAEESQTPLLLRGPLMQSGKNRAERSAAVCAEIRPTKAVKMKLPNATDMIVERYRGVKTETYVPSLPFCTYTRSLEQPPSMYLINFIHLACDTPQSIMGRIAVSCGCGVYKLCTRTRGSTSSIGIVKTVATKVELRR